MPGGSDGKESVSSAGDLGSIPESGRSPGEGNGNSLQYSCLRDFHGQRSLAGYSPWGHRESDMTGRITHIHILLMKHKSKIWKKWYIFFKDTIHIILGPSCAIESLIKWYIYSDVISYIISHMNTMENIVLGRYYFRRHFITSECALSSSIVKMWFWNAQPWKIETLINSFDHVIKFLLVTWKIILIYFLKGKGSISLFPHSFLLFERQT